MRNWQTLKVLLEKIIQHNDIEKGKAILMWIWHLIKNVLHKSNYSNLDFQNLELIVSKMSYCRLKETYIVKRSICYLTDLLQNIVIVVKPLFICFQKLMDILIAMIETSILCQLLMKTIKVWKNNKNCGVELNRLLK